MVVMRFIYMNNKYDINEIDLNSSFQNYIYKYSGMINQKAKDLKFICNGKILLFDNNQKIKDICSLPIIKILVINLNKKEIKNEISNKILCNICNNLALFTFNEDKKISLEDCKNNHKTQNITLKLFLENQKKESKIKCEFCGNYKSYYNDEFYINSDERNICP